MQKVCDWKDKGKGQFRLSDQKSRLLEKGSCSLTIAAAGGCSKMAEGLSEVLKKNEMESPEGENYFQSIVIITDRDESDTEDSFIKKVEDVLSEEGVVLTDKIENNQWSECEMKTRADDQIRMKLLVMVIPFEENGAMETFLLNAIAKQDGYDNRIIEDCKNFVDNTDIDRKYLSKRRLVTKAKFDAYFCVRTAAEAFNQRRDIIKNVPWEDYAAIKKDFKLLEDITDM
ncbi:MAG: hypothetical protein K2N44_08170 [Lachnospiraceae bacterium]|nr:hypothetical protein [Lachnospiraceae bacterium]